MLGEVRSGVGRIGRKEDALRYVIAMLLGCEVESVP